MAFDARQVALAGPAAVAVHDDCDVLGQAIEVDLARELDVRLNRAESTPEAVQATWAKCSFYVGSRGSRGLEVLEVLEVRRFCLLPIALTPFTVGPGP